MSIENIRLISYSRGHITIMDRPGLEEVACECYRVVQTEYERLLGAKIEGGLSE